MALGSKRRGRPRDEPALVAALLRGTLLVAEDPHAALTIDSVVAAAGTSKPRVYRYFRSAEAAFSRVLAEIVDAEAARLVDAVARDGTADVRFDGLIDFLTSPSPERRTSTRLTLRAREHASSDPALAKRVQAADERAFLALRELFDHVARDGGLTGGYTSEGAARALYCLCIGASTMLVSSTGARPEVLTHFWRAATRPNGHV